MQKADYLLRLMKQRTDALMASDEKLQQFLMWVNEKSLSVKVPYKPAAVRAFYFAVAVKVPYKLAAVRAFYLDRVLDRALDDTFNRSFPLTLDLDRTLLLNLDPDLALDINLDHALDLAFDPNLNLNLPHVLDLTLDFAHVLDPELKEALQQLKEQLPDPDREAERLKTWWQANGKVWTEQLRAVMIVYRNIGHNWQFSWRLSHPYFPSHQYIEVLKQRKVLQQYYEANQLLVNCLNSSCNVTPAVREEIEETLLLPIAEIQKRNSCQDK
jgi:predicted NACHT family NTPase